MFRIRQKRERFGDYTFKNPKAQTKLIQVMQGAIYDVIVDLRKDSPTFKQWRGYILSADNHRQLLVPKGFAHGFVHLSHTIVMYKVDEYYSANHDSGYFGMIKT